MTDRYEACRAVLAAVLALGLTLGLPASPAMARTQGPIIIVYRDDASNVRQLKGTAHYDGRVGRDASVPFTVANDSGEQVCSGTLTRESRRTGKFSLTCFGGYFSGSGSYERQATDRLNSFVARGQTAHGLPLMLVVGTPAGYEGDRFISP